MPCSVKKDFINIGPKERLASILGGLLLLAGLKKRSATGAGFALTGGALLFRGATGYCPVVAQLGRTPFQSSKKQSTRIDESITINRPRQELYAFWRDVENLPGFMQHLRSVHWIDQKHAEWTAHIPKGTTAITWKAEIIQDRPDEVLAWRSLPGADFYSALEIRFKDAPRDHGTVVKISIAYRPPSKEKDSNAARLLTPDFEHLIREDIHRFKELMEIGILQTSR